MFLIGLWEDFWCLILKEKYWAIGVFYTAKQSKGRRKKLIGPSAKGKEKKEKGKEKERKEREEEDEKEDEDDGGFSGD